MLPSLTELDLSENLISSWSFVAELATALPSLRALNLSGNRLALPSLADAAALPSLPGLPGLAGLQTLVLNGCGVGWEQAVAVARQLPSLRELHLCGNRLASLQLPAASPSAAAAAAAGLEGLSLSPGDPAASSSGVDSSDGGIGSSSSGSSSTRDSTAALLAAAFPQLELLDLEDNALASWHADVALLGQLPRLSSLLLSGNRLADVQYCGGELAQGMHCKPAAMSHHACQGCCCQLGQSFQPKLLSSWPAAVCPARRLHLAACSAAGGQPAGQLAGRQPAGHLPCAGGGSPV